MLASEGAEEAVLGAPPTRGQRWVVVTGLLPLAKQKKEYETVFAGTGRADRGAGMSGSRFPGGAAMAPGAMPGGPYGATMPEMFYGATGLGIPTPVELPVYAYYRVERAEAGTGAEDHAGLRWEPLHVRQMLESQAKRWRSLGGEVVAPQYLHSGSWAMAFPLGPLVNASWGPQCAHEPEIPFLDKASGADVAPGGMIYGMDAPYSMPGMAASPARGATASKGAKARSRPAAAPAPEKSQPARLADEPDAGVEGAAPMGAAPGAFPSAMPYAGPMMPMGMTPGIMPGAKPGMMRAGTGQDAAGVPYQLFRFFDFTVEPGKRYRYRVRLVLVNPNYGLNPADLEDEKQSQVKFLEDAGAGKERGWSEPPEAVVVPRDVRVLVGSVVLPPEQHAAVKEPVAEFGIAKFDIETGQTLFAGFPDAEDRAKGVPYNVCRGKLANFVGVSKPITKTSPYGVPPGVLEFSPYDSPMMMPGMRPTPSMPGTPVKPKPAKTEPGPTMDLISDYLLVDMSGGRTVPGKSDLQTPSRVLWLDPDGRLVVRADEDDEEEYERLKPPEEPAGPRGRTMTGASPRSPPASAYPPGTSPGSPPGMDYSIDPAGVDMMYMQQMQKGGAKGRKPPPKPRRSTGS